MAETTTTRAQEDTRTIVALMVTAVVFSLVSHEVTAIRGAANNQPQPGGKDPLTTGGRIIVGGAVATTLLLLLSHAGEEGRAAAFGLTIVTFATAVLVSGSNLQVWQALNNALSSAGPGGTPSGSTSPTTPTTPTHGAVPTAAALSNIA